MTDKSRLEEMLRAIQDLKSEKYVGTATALKYIKKVSALHTAPKEIAEEVNNEVIARGRKRIIYPATPERVLGLGDTIEKLIDDTENEYDDELSREERGVFHLFQIETPLHILGNFHNSLAYRPLEIALKLAPYFFSVQSPDTTDKLFGKDSAEYLLYDYNFFNDVIKNRIMKKASAMNWQHILSKQHSAEIEKQRRIFYEDTELDLIERGCKMLTDKVIDKLENRREVISQYLSDGIRDALFSTYDGALSDADKRIKIWRKQKIRDEKVGQEFALTKGAINILEFYEVVRDYLVKDKNFVERFLKS